MRLAFWSKCVPLQTGSLSLITHEIIKEAAQALAARGRANHVRAEIHLLSLRQKKKEKKNRKAYIYQKTFIEMFLLCWTEITSAQRMTG